VNELFLKKHAEKFPDIRLFNITEIAKDYFDAHKRFIAEGGVFDAIYKSK
jgi:sulfate transport system substrate-binding protein